MLWCHFPNPKGAEWSMCILNIYNKRYLIYYHMYYEIF